VAQTKILNMAEANFMLQNLQRLVCIPWRNSGVSKGRKSVCWVH